VVAAAVVHSACAIRHLIQGRGACVGRGRAGGAGAGCLCWHQCHCAHCSLGGHVPRGCDASPKPDSRGRWHSAEQGPTAPTEEVRGLVWFGVHSTCYCCSLLAAGCSPLTAHRSPLTAHRSPLTAHLQLEIHVQRGGAVLQHTEMTTAGGAMRCTRKTKHENSTRAGARACQDLTRLN
jgi:hypothetical protein